jgi:hypothetical protein
MLPHVRPLLALGELPVIPSLAFVVVSLVLAGHWAGGRWMMGWWWEITASDWWSNSDHLGNSGILCSSVHVRHRDEDRDLDAANTEAEHRQPAKWGSAISASPLVVPVD